MHRILKSALCLLALTVQSQGHLTPSPEFHSCDLDGCKYTIVTGQREIARNGAGRLLELDILNGRTDFDDSIGRMKDAIEWEVASRKVWVFCSTLYPIIMTESPIGSSAKILNFGGFGVSYTYLAHAKMFLYACNSVRSSEPSNELTERLGYRERPHDSDRIESMIKKPADILELTNNQASR